MVNEFEMVNTMKSQAVHTVLSPPAPNRPRRSHNLGACRTCRRRHVKCDQKRPVCRTCKTRGVPCEGFVDEVRWMRSSGGNGNANKAHLQHGTRRHLYTEQSRLSMSASLGSNLVSGSISASLAEIDLKTRDPDHPPVGDIVVGPFAVLDFALDTPQEIRPRPQEASGADRQGTDLDLLPCTPPQTAPSHQLVPQETTIPSPTPPTNDSPSELDSFLHWSDILGLSPEQPGFFQPSMLDFGIDLDPPHPATDQDIGFRTALSVMAEDIAPAQQEIDTRNAGPFAMSPRSGIDVASTFLDAAALAKAPFFFKHFNGKVVPQMMIMPLCDRSPWKVLNLSAAMATYSDLTILGAQNISHARLANLYGVLACSAAHFAAEAALKVVATVNQWQQDADLMFEQAKDQMQMSLKYETREPKKAKYKDQLMAICCLAEYTVISGQQQHARGFMVNAEYILRKRGLLKQRISQKARLLHHVYTWLRLVSESTYVLHDYAPSSSFIEALDVNFQRRHPHRISGSAMPEDDPRLDDFLRLEPHESDSDLNINESKDRLTGLHDIHLQDSRNFSDTLYKQIYGIPETWLSFLSQTTRLANAMETFRIARKSYKNASLDAWETLYRRSVRLESLICSYDPILARGVGPDHLADQAKAHGYMLRALNAALVIFFYRRIRQVHPAILGAHVDAVIVALADFTAALPQGHPTGLGSAWSAFIAGCEALTMSRREAILLWLDNAISTCGLASFKTARKIMVDLWRQQDEQLENNCGDSVPTWIGLVQERQIWPLLC